MYDLLAHFDTDTARRAWSTWIGDSDSSGGIASNSSRSHLLLRKHPPVFESVLTQESKLDYESIRPSFDHAMNCYCAFVQNFDPLTKLFFVQDLLALRVKAIDHEREHIPDDDCALLLAIFLAGVRTMTEKECSVLLKHSKASLMSHYQSHLEKLFAQIGIFAIDNIKIIKAVMIYMVSVAYSDKLFG